MTIPVPLEELPPAHLRDNLTTNRYPPPDATGLKPNSSTTRDNQAIATSDKASEVHRLDQLIRAGTSLLWIMQASRSRWSTDSNWDRGRKRDQPLDKIATLLSKGKRERVTCVMANQKAKGYHIFQCVGDKGANLKEGKEALKCDGGEGPRLVAAGGILEAHTWIERFLKGGPFEEQIYYSYLQQFANDHLAAGSRRKKRDCIEDARSLLIVNSIDTMMKQLNLRIPSTNIRFLELFDEGTLEPEEVREGFNPGCYPEIAAPVKESKLLSSMEKLGLKGKFFWNYNDGSLILTDVSIGFFHTYVCRLIKDIAQLIEFELKPYLDSGCERKLGLQWFNAVLDNLHGSLKALKILVSNSRAFKRKYLPHLLVVHQRKRLSLPLTTMTTELKAVQIPDERNDQNAILNNLPGIFNQDISTKDILSWLKDFIGPYSDLATLFDLMQSPVTLYTVAIPAAPTSANARQASLGDVYAALMDDGKYSAINAEEAMLDFAREKAARDPQSSWTNLLLKGRKWEESFDGEYHMGALLCCLKSVDPVILGRLGDVDWKTLKGCNSKIGTSRSCCYTCFRYCQITLGRNSINEVQTTGKFRPWAAPPWEKRVDVLQQLWDDVKAALLEALEKDNLIQPVNLNTDTADDWGSGGWGGCGGGLEDSETSWEYEAGAEVVFYELEDDKDYYYNAGKALEWMGEESNSRGF